MTWLCHLWLGAVDGLAPMGAWVAITGKLPLEAWELGGAVACWVAGFDLFYSLFDVDVDRREGLHSVATRFGVARRLLGRARAARATVVLLALVGLGLASASGTGSASPRRGAARGRARARPAERPAAAERAFFTMNGVISVVFLVFVLGQDAVVIRAHGLAKRYGSKRIFEGLELDVERGGFVLVTGPNGVRQDDAAAARRRSRVPDGG